MPQSPAKAPWDPHSSPVIINCPIIFSWISSMVWNLFPFKGGFSFGKSQKSQATNLVCSGAESPGWFNVSQKNSSWDMMHVCAHCHDEAANHQLPIVVASESSSFHRGMFKPNTKFDADSLLYSFSHFECNSHTVHMLTQWLLLSPLTSTVKSSLLMHVHSSPLSLATRLYWLSKPFLLD